MELAPEIFALLIAVAGIAGFIDAMAGGGGLLVVPALLAAGLPPITALGTNKLQSAFGTGSACWHFARTGHIIFRPMLLPIIAVFTGSIAGAITIQFFNPAFLSTLVPVLLIAVAGYFLFAPSLGDVDRHQRISIRGYTPIAFVLGFYDGFFGPGMGAFLTIAFVTLLGFGLVKATAHTKLLNFSSNIGAILVLGLSGHVYWTLGLAMACASVIGGRLGSMTAIRFGGKLIRPLLVVMSLAMTIKLLLG